MCESGCHIICLLFSSALMLIKFGFADRPPNPPRGCLQGDGETERERDFALPNEPEASCRAMGCIRAGRALFVSAF